MEGVILSSRVHEPFFSREAEAFFAVLSITDAYIMILEEASGFPFYFILRSSIYTKCWD